MSATNTSINLDLLSAIDAIEKEKNERVIVDVFADFVSRFGFDHVAIGQLRNPALSSAKKTKGFLISNWPTDWWSQWLDESLIIHDPVARFALKTKRTFSWREAYQHSTKYGHKIFERSREYGIRDGLAVPIYTGGGLPGCISLSGGPKNPPKKTLAMIELLSLHTYVRLEALYGTAMPTITVRITPRETDVLHYAAAGKTNWEIGKILAISPNSVRDHLKSATKKLDCANRAHAVAIAIERNLILP